ncbi:GMC family oxidoreductase [Panacibacter sp. DH6]|uniref:GMC family oxidoreductase n=1 Tax=Panacibacter microcysteis TaxID=2793269 RepID=A0A931E3D4_9BACT|nr:GMC family oxidoreductase [Panacibacter microcysteis]MBG9375377.1 GMC family oxidoreductase [Panacibacter microcysteis]
MPGDSLNINNRAIAQNTYDAIVVGSGISGGWAAKELCEKGLKTLVLERGRNVEHIKDYTDTTKDPWELVHHGSNDNTDKENSPIQSKCYAYNEVSGKFFVNDKEHPYNQVKPFDWIRGYHVGGRSIMWGRQCYRWSDIDFEANAKDGFGVDWPIRYKDLEPWYTYVEPFVGISGSVENLPQLPDGKFLPPMEMNCIEKHVAERIKKSFADGRTMIIGRTANHTAKVGDRGPCQFRNKCHEGCPFSGYFSSNAATLPAAAKTGNLTLRPFSIVQEVIYDKQTGKAKGVRIIDAETMKTEEYFAKIVFLNASTLGTAHILLNSVSDAFPDGLGNSSGQVGHNLMDHHYGVGAYGDSDDFADQYFYGRRANGIYIPRFRNISDSTKMKEYVRGFGYQGGGSRGRINIDEGIGATYKESLTEPGKWTFGIGSWGEHLPYFENKVTLNKDKKDKWGLPTLDIDCEFKDNEMAMRKDMMNSAAEMLEKAGLKNVGTYDNMPAPGFCIHEMGTARMGKDPKTSVLNGFNQMHEVKNVFITDGACMASSACQNPSVTYMALTARAADYAVAALKKGNI